MPRLTKGRERELLATIRDLLALAHALNSHHVTGRNPYSFPIVKAANRLLSGSEYEVDFSLHDACEALAASDGESTGLRGRPHGN